MSSTLKSLLAVSAALAIAGCGQAKKTNAFGGAVVQVSTYAAKADVLQIELTISDPANPNNPVLVQQVLTRAASGDVFTGVFQGLPAGTPLEFFAQATDGATTLPLYEGTVTQTLVEGQLAQIAMLLQEIHKATPFANSAPVVQSLTASALNIGIGGLVNVAVGALDADGDPLTYAWSATGGSFSDPALPNPVWTAPSPFVATDYVLSVAVSDTKKATARAQFTITVTNTTLGNVAVVNAILRNAPVIALSNTIRVVDPAIGPPYDVNLSAKVTLDPTTAPGHAPVSATYLWEVPGNDGCVGSFVDAAGQPLTDALDVILTVTAPSAGGTCAVSFTATDSEGAVNVGTLDVMVDPSAAAVAPPPRLVSAFQSSTTVGAGGLVEVAADFFQDTGAVAPTWSVAGSVQNGLPYLGTSPVDAGAFANVFGNTVERFTFPAACDPNGPVTFTLRATAPDGVNAVPIDASTDLTVVFCP